MKNLIYRNLLILAMLCVPLIMSAQVTIGSGNKPSPQALLDLDASLVKKGLHLPRLTELERDALVSEASSDDEKALNVGLAIINLDTDCIDYWNKEEWVSLCHGTANPIVEINCNTVRIFGQYYAGAPLNDSHYITLSVEVTRRGNYTIIASTGNGFYFQANGIFETTGVFNMRLEAMGTPAQTNSQTPLTFTCNGQIIGASCDRTIDVQPLRMGYTIVCEDIKVFGSYQTRTFMDLSNYVEVPIDVLQGGEVTSFVTNMANGVRFSVIRDLTNISGPYTLRLIAEGTPRQEGEYTFTFTTDGSVQNTCSFKVYMFSTLGTFEEPACNCLAIYEERPLIPNGEYWLQSCKTTGATARRTFCDIAGGGWTLMWSYSENTARNVYAPTGSMAVSGTTLSVHVNTAIGQITTAAVADGPTDWRVPYENFRMPRQEWLDLVSGTTGQIKVRITSNPRDMRDEWALNNYAIMSPRNQAENVLFTAANDMIIPAVGMIYGKRWEVRTSGVRGNRGSWDEVSGARAEGDVYNGSGWCTHWDFYNQGSSTQFQVVPNPGNLSGTNNSIAINQIDNSFGDFSQTMPNHHFGKCTADDYSFATKTCAPSALQPHSFNNGQGRYVQWYTR